MIIAGQVGINLTDPVFTGIYHGKKAHESDVEDVLKRAVDAGCVKLMVTGSDLRESRNAVKLAMQHRMFQPKCPRGILLTEHLL